MSKFVVSRSSEGVTAMMSEAVTKRNKVRTYVLSPEAADRGGARRRDDLVTGWDRLLTFSSFHLDVQLLTC